MGRVFGSKERVMFSVLGLTVLGIACAFIGASIDSYRLEIRRLLLACKADVAEMKAICKKDFAQIKTDVGELKDLNNRIVDFGGEQ
jgi:hypothetical protein